VSIQGVVDDEDFHFAFGCFGGLNVGLSVDAKSIWCHRASIRAVGSIREIARFGAGWLIYPTVPLLKALFQRRLQGLRITTTYRMVAGTFPPPNNALQGTRQKRSAPERERWKAIGSHL
jgi:hypothetical protein